MRVRARVPSILFYGELRIHVNRTVGSQLVMDPMLVCKKTRRLKGKLADICRKEPSLLKEIAKGIQVGTRECQYQFRNRRWNCTTVRRSLKKILLRGESSQSRYCAKLSVANQSGEILISRPNNRETRAGRRVSE